MVAQICLEKHGLWHEPGVPTLQRTEVGGGCAFQVLV